MVSELAKRHPTWPVANIEFIEQAKNQEEKTKREVLFETFCWKCEKELGLHNWNGKVWECR